MNCHFSHTIFPGYWKSDTRNLRLDFSFRTTEPQKEVESEQKEVENDKEPEASGTSSWWGGVSSYSSWMDKAVSSVTTAVESAKIKVRMENFAKLICNVDTYDIFFIRILQSNEVYGFVSKDLEEVSSHANTMVKSSSMTIKKTLEVRDFEISMYLCK